MDASLRRELDYCINELNSIVRQLNSVSADVSGSIQGLDTRKYVRTLEDTAEKYNKAVKKLNKIR